MVPSARAEARLVTADDLLAMQDDGLLRELVGGEVFVSPPPGEEHGVVAAGILISLGHHVMSHGLGEGTRGRNGVQGVC